MQKQTLLALLVTSVLAGCATAPNEQDANDIAVEPQPPVVEQPVVDDDGIVYENESDVADYEVIPEEEVEPVEEAEEPVVEVLPTEDENGALILGNKEHVYFLSVKQYFTAGVDENLALSVVTATGVTPFERNGDKWVKFKVMVDGKESKEYSLPVKRWQKVASAAKTEAAEGENAAKDQEVPKEAIVTAWIQVGKLRESTDFLLSETVKQPHAFMLGQSFYRDLAVVDSSREFVQPKTVE